LIENGDLSLVMSTQVSVFGFGVSLPQTELKLCSSVIDSKMQTNLRLVNVAHTWSTRMFGWLFGLDKLFELLIQSFSMLLSIDNSLATPDPLSARNPMHAELVFTVPTSSIATRFLVASVQKLRIMDIVRFFRDLCAALTLDLQRHVDNSRDIVVTAKPETN